MIIAKYQIDWRGKIKSMQSNPKFPLWDWFQTLSLYGNTTRKPPELMVEVDLNFARGYLYIVLSTHLYFADS